ncbi:MAG: ABC transporter substrate-binding protein [Bryobacteraceae bacterium]
MNTIRAVTRRSVLQAAAAALLRGRALAAGPKTYLVGSTATGVPFSFMDLKTNTLTGAMVDIVRAIALDADLRIEMRIMAFGALLPSLLSGKIDIISAAMLKTPAREKVVDFSEPVYSYGGGLIVPARDTREYRKIEDLKGLVVGAQVGTRFFDQLRTAGAKEVKTYDNLIEMLGDLSVGRIDAAYGDAPIFAYQISQARTRKVRFVQSFKPPTIEEVCLVVRKGDAELLGRLNASVRRIKSGAIKSAIERWSLN